MRTRDLHSSPFCPFRIASTSADLNTRVRFTFLYHFRIWILASRFCRCCSDHLEICRSPNSTGNVLASASIPFRPLCPLILTSSTDYMDRRRILTVDPNYFPLARMQEIVSYWPLTYIRMTNITARFFVLLPRLHHVPMILMRSTDDRSFSGISSGSRVHSIQLESCLRFG